MEGNPRFIEIGRRIQLRRKELRIRQYELAEQLNVSNNHISAIENGREKPSIDLLLELCEALAVTPDYLLLGNMHANDISQNIMDSLRLCSENDVELARKFIILLVERNKNNFNDKHII